MDNTIIQQGMFTATGGTINFRFRSDVDWLTLYNDTEITGNAANHGCIYMWQRGMLPGRGWVQYHPAADQTLAIDGLAAGTGFTLVDSSSQAPGAAVVVAGASNVVQPIVTTADTTGLVDGTIVRLASNVGAESLNGFDFEIDTIVAGVSFRMRYAMANAAGAAGVGGTYRVIPYHPIFYPRRRYIINITQAVNAVIRTSVQHGYIVGQKIRVNLANTSFGMVEIDGLVGTVTAVTASEITTDIDSTAFSAFTFALPAQVPFTMPTVFPYGEDTGAALLAGTDILGDATENEAWIGITAPGGILAPGGTNGDVIIWRAGKSFSVTNI